LKILERVVPALAPPRQRHELEGAISQLNLAILPDEMVGRIANGEDPLVVLATSPNVAALLNEAREQRT